MSESEQQKLDLVKAAISQIESQHGSSGTTLYSDSAALPNWQPGSAPEKTTTLKSLGEAKDPAEKVRIAMQAVQSLKRELGLAERQRKTVETEKEALTSALAKANSAKEKLEKLCRGLQADNKLLQKEQRDSEARRKEVLSTVDDVQKAIKGADETRAKVIAENDELREKLRDLLKQFELTQAHHKQELKAKGLEVQLGEAKLKHNEALLAEAGEHMDKLKGELRAGRERELTLHKTIEEYKASFEQFQPLLKQSQAAYEEFGTKTKDLSKRLLEAQKENQDLRVKAAKMDLEFLKMAEERTAKAAELQDALAAREKLTNLCRSLQEERRSAQAEIQRLKAAPAAADAADAEPTTTADEAATS